MVHQVKEAYTTIRQLNENVNPVKRVLLDVCGGDGQLYINEIANNGNGDGNEGRMQNQLDLREEMNGVHNQVQALRRENSELKTELREF